MRSGTATVDDFLEEKSGTIREDLEQLRRLVRRSPAERTTGTARSAA